MQANDEKAVVFVPVVLDLDVLKENGMQMGVTGYKPYRIGNRVCQCMFVEGTEEQRKAVINSYEKEFKAETRSHRCAVVSENGGLKRCPDEIKCDECPFYRFHAKPKQGNITFSALDLTDDAGNEVFKEFHDEIERKIKKEYADLSDWVGKLLGNTLRISGLLCRADVIRSHDFLDVPESLVVDKETMINAVRIGKYYLNQAQFVFDALPENKMYKEASRVLEMIAVRDLKELDRRTVMRNLRSFKKAADVQPVLDFLEDYGYIIPEKPKQQQFTGRPPLPKYRVNPKAKEMLRHVGRELSYGF